jgi:hypothetical protein
VAGADHSDLLAEAISLLHGAQDQFYLPKAITAIAAETTQESELRQLLGIVNGCSDEYARSRSLAALIEYVPDTFFYEIADAFGRQQFKEGREAAIAITCEFSKRGSVSKAVESYLSLPSWAKWRAAKGIASHLNENQLLEILNDCERIYDHPKLRSMVIEAILPFLPSDLLGIARKIVFANPNKFERKPSVIAFVRRVCEVGSPLDELDGYCDLMSSQNRLDGFYDFANIVPLLFATGGIPLVTKATRAIEDAVRWWS